MKLVSPLLAAALCLPAFHALGQETDDSDVFELDEFVVSGTRASLIKAREFKRESKIVSDSIVAEDIAKFPDLNLAESLQRLPGVAINREAGEGRRVSLRGLGPDFTRVQLNGMEVLGNVDSPQDSRGQGSRDRAFDFNIFASELFNRLDVYKSMDATQNEGGLAGTVGLHTAKPFDYDGFNAGFSAKVGTNTYTDDFQPRTAFQISNIWDDTFGALFSVAYSQRETVEQGTNTYRWRPSSSAQGSDISALTAEEQAKINNGETRWARGNRQSAWGSDQERLGLTSAFQWKPSDDLMLTLDILHGEFSSDRSEIHLNSRGSNSSSWLGGGTTVDGVTYPNSVINDIEIKDTGEVVYVDVSGGNAAVETRRQHAENTFDQIVLSGDWRINDNLRADFLVGTETSSFDIPISDKFYFETFGDVVSDYTQDPFYLHNTWGFDTTDPDNWRAHEIDFAASYQETNFDNVKADFTYFLASGSQLKFGASHQKFSNDGYIQRNDNVLRSDFQSGAVDDDVSAYAVVFTDHKDQDWAIADFDKALTHLGLTRDPGSIQNVYEVEESTDAAYFMYEWSSKLGEIGFTGNVGVRAFDTSIKSSGRANIGDIVVKSGYDDILPALNTTFELRENLLLRAAISQNINRPGLGSLAVNGSVSESNGEVTISMGNPSLQPYYSDNIDVALEWYFGEVGSFAVGVYRKDISGFIGTDLATDIPYSETGLPLDLLPGLTNSTNVAEFRRPINYEDSSIDGLEFSLQSDLDFLPAPFDKFGFIGNLSFIDGELDYASPAEQAQGISHVSPISGLSKKLGNATLYYETNNWGARVSANYRQGYVAWPLAIGNDEFGDGFNSTTYVDFSAFYQINDKLKLTFDAINLTNQREEQYSDLVARRLYNTTSSGTTFFTGVNYQF
ncbi:TonB-dependent receptor [Pelagicoccus sp. NFK12]|uniref:TonB-dependent receptor n=1 Tax=Pelagicoccus enzymogenes TaxID=2773457 RepID=A0A927IHN3_9BACT|nr:TonB-dependent receptor [Pelagicoccus enzymogenes]MBD5782472.1 TonB-dependent receptor [Pelagicoccus enzymogenes]